MLLMWLSLLACGGCTAAKNDPDMDSGTPCHLDDFDCDGFTPAQGDCNDDDETVYPGAVERCDNMDQDCDDAVDEGAAGLTVYYIDADQDGFGDDSTAIIECASPGGDYNAIEGGDCNDNNTNVYPGAPELCDGQDNACIEGPWDASIEDGTVSFFPAQGEPWNVSGPFNDDSLPYPMSITNDGELHFCAGRYYTHIEVATQQVEIRGLGSNLTSLSGAGRGPVIEAGSAPVLTIRDLSVREGVHDHGGGLAMEAGGTLTISDTIWQDNRAAVGGALRLHYVTGLIQRTTFSSNHSNSQGGAIYVEGRSIHIEDSTFMDNTAEAGSGGGLSSLDATLVVDGAEFTNNQSIYGNGGAIAADVCQGSIQGSSFSENSGQYGGALNLYTCSPMSLSTSNFLDNEATQSGGAINVSNSTLEVAQSTFSDNTAEQSGGAIGIRNASVGLTDGNQLTGNTALHGGGLHLLDVTDVSCADSEIGGNSATYGRDSFVQAGGDWTSLTSTGCDWTNPSEGSEGQVCVGDDCFDIETTDFSCDGGAGCQL